MKGNITKKKFKKEDLKYHVSGFLMAALLSMPSMCHAGTAADVTTSTFLTSLDNIKSWTILVGVIIIVVFGLGIFRKKSEGQGEQSVTKEVFGIVFGIMVAAAVPLVKAFAKSFGIQ